jgi:hypothetical protein
MEANLYSTYDDAAREYLDKLYGVTQLLQDAAPIVSQSANAANSTRFMDLADDIADISATMAALVQKYQNDSNPLVQEGIFCQFIDQATTELLLEMGLLQIVQEEQTGIPSSAATQATHSAALLEAINAAEKSMTMPLSQGLTVGASYRITDASNVTEAASSFQVVFDCTTNSISRRVQELGSDITMDLIAGTEWTTVVYGASSLQSPAKNFLEAIDKNDGSLASRAALIAGKMLLNVYEKIVVLANQNIANEMREKVGEWLEKIKQTEKIELFSVLVENLYSLDALIRSMERSLQDSVNGPESINRASDRIKTYSDKFIVLTGKMRKLEDAIRLGKLIQLPQLMPTMIALQVELLSSLVYAGYDYINRCEKAARSGNSRPHP